MIKESKYCREVMKKYFNKELVMTKEDNEDFENSNKYWICGNDLKNIEALHIDIVISILN